jgi:branched-chain amino acid transport system ATP-binding protein
MEELSIGLYGFLLVLTFFVFPKGLAVLFPGRYAKGRYNREDVTSRAMPVHPKRLEIVGEPRRVMEFESISMKFGGTMALSNVQGSVERGRILGIIGPNGAGKTTLLNVLSGFLSPQKGKVIFEGADISSKDPHLRARMGIGRTFQISNLFMGMTVIENVMVGGHIRGTCGMFGTGMNSVKARREESAIMHAAMESLDFLGLLNRAHEKVENVPFGEQKLVEMARALTLKPRLLLLDEPASGLNTAETAALAGLIARIRNDGISVIIVEHNMPLIMGISDQVLVLDFGTRIALGTPQDVSANERVIEAYLGKERPYA